MGQRHVSAEWIADGVLRDACTWVDILWQIAIWRFPARFPLFFKGFLFFKDFLFLSLLFSDKFDQACQKEQKQDQACQKEQKQVVKKNKNKRGEKRPDQNAF